ncbi:MAG: hypothetical protein QME77_00595 [bacterium]|nr:hypothetical protein [bacterium]
MPEETGKAAPTTTEAPVSSLNPGGRPAAAPQTPAVTVRETVNSGVEIRAGASEDENLKKLLGGLGAYQNPLRPGAWQVDHRYRAEAIRRMEAAGYAIAET